MCQELSAIHPGRDIAGDRQVLQVVSVGPHVDRNKLGKEFRDLLESRQILAGALNRLKKKTRLTSFPCNRKLM